VAEFLKSEGAFALAYVRKLLDVIRDVTRNDLDEVSESGRLLQIISPLEFALAQDALPARERARLANYKLRLAGLQQDAQTASLNRGVFTVILRYFTERTDDYSDSDVLEQEFRQLRNKYPSRREFSLIELLFNAYYPRGDVAFQAGVEERRVELEQQQLRQERAEGGEPQLTQKRAQEERDDDEDEDTQLRKKARTLQLKFENAANKYFK